MVRTLCSSISSIKGSLYEASIKRLLESQVETSEPTFLTYAFGSQISEMGSGSQDLPPKWVICKILLPQKLQIVNKRMCFSWPNFFLI